MRWDGWRRYEDSLLKFVVSNINHVNHTCAVVGLMSVRAELFY